VVYKKKNTRLYKKLSAEQKKYYFFSIVFIF
jgi:hypothetical protein